MGAIAVAELQPDRHLRRHLPAEMQECVGATLLGGVPSKILIDDLAQEPEHFDEVRLSGAVATDEYVQRLEIERLVADRLEILNRQLLEGSHPFKLSYLARCVGG